MHSKSKASLQASIAGRSGAVLDVLLVGGSTTVFQTQGVVDFMS